jgi:hypothetical protein
LRAGKTVGRQAAVEEVQRVWFRTLSLLIAAALLVKALVALTARRRFYAIRQRQYATESLPPKFLIAPALVLALTALSAYASLFHYRPWGWVVVGFLTLLSAMALDHVLRWRVHRLAMLKVVESPKVWQVDCVLLALGSAFAALAVFVY